MKKRHSRLAGMFLLLGSGIPAFCLFAYHFYFLFPNSHQLFQIRHQCFSHLEFHTDSWSYDEGASIGISLSSSKEDSVFLSFYSPLSPDQLLFADTFEADFQPVPERPAVTGTDWQINYDLSLPSHIQSGWYIIQLSNQGFTQRSSVFIRPPVDAVRKSVAILFSTNTWNAYNHWGGQSFYSRNRASTISFQRPQLLADPFIENTYPNHQFYFQGANQDLHLARLLDSAGIAFDAYSMDDLEQEDSRLSQYSKLIFSTHTEYWSWNMMHQLNRCLDSGVSALFLAGNVAAYITSFDPSTRRISMHPTRAREGFWQISDTAGIRPFGTEYSYFGFQTYSPFEVLNDSSWVWEGIEVSQGDLLGEVSEAYDYTPNQDFGWDVLIGLSKKGNYGAASGLEIDKIYEGTPDNWVTLASGLNSLRPPGHGEVYPDGRRQWNSGEGADMGYYVHSGGGIVFHASSMAFVGALPHDARLRQLVLNLVRFQH